MVKSELILKNNNKKINKFLQLQCRMSDLNIGCSNWKQIIDTFSKKKKKTKKNKQYISFELQVYNGFYARVEFVKKNLR